MGLPTGQLPLTGRHTESSMMQPLLLLASFLAAIFLSFFCLLFTNINVYYSLINQCLSSLSPCTSGYVSFSTYSCKHEYLLNSSEFSQASGNYFLATLPSDRIDYLLSLYPIYTILSYHLLNCLYLFTVLKVTLKIIFYSWYSKQNVRMECWKVFDKQLRGEQVNG